MTQILSHRILKTEDVDWNKLTILQQESFKDLSDADMLKLRNSILSNQFTQPFYVWENSGLNYCLDGYHRIKVLKQLVSEGWDVPSFFPATFIDCQNEKEAAKLVLQYSSMYAKITVEGFDEFIARYEIDAAEILSSIDLPEFDEIDYLSKLNEEIGQVDKIESSSLKDRFLVPPFSVLDTRQGYWQDRKRAWTSLGFNSQESREDIELIAESGQSTAVYELRNKMRAALGRDPEWDEIIAEAKKRKMHIFEGASIFDPVMAELAYRWFCPDAGTILDPFAGGSVRGIVAAYLGYQYYGIDLRQDQVEANRRQYSVMPALSSAPTWLTGDSNEVIDNMELFADYIFSCPPYHDLEKYSDDPADLSNMDYDQFMIIYKSIISKAVAKLKDNRFACFVVGDIRDKEGFYRNFVSDTISAFQEAGMKLYNEVILVNVAGSLPMRVGGMFPKFRKTGKMHQNVLVFYKGDIKSIPEELGELTEINDLLKILAI